MRQKRLIKTWSTPVTAEEREAVPCAVCGGSRFKPDLACEGFAYRRCACCGLVQMNPQPTASDVARRYGQAHGKDYLSYELANEAAFLKLQQLALGDAGFDELEKELFRQTPAPHVLDIGCATGALLLYLRDRGWLATGVEISPSAEYARSRGAAEGVSPLDVRSLPLEENHFPEHNFDLVLASHVIEHLNSPGSFVNEVYRILKPGGFFLVTTPNIAGFQARLFGSTWRSAIFDHLYLFSVRTLKKLLASAGFTIEGVYTWGGLAAGAAPPWLKKFADRAVKKLGLGDVMLIKAQRRLKISRDRG